MCQCIPIDLKKDAAKHRLVVCLFLSLKLKQHHQQLFVLYMFDSWCLAVEND